MRLTQTPSILCSPTPIDRHARLGAWRAVVDRLLCALALVRTGAPTATDHLQMSAHMMRDIGLVRGEPPHLGAWSHGPRDFRLWASLVA